ncbi:hypothetical protein TRAPUB_7913 [Trametes pubescens]|uniref:Uncharacterized protein n=1 Tax=Trametes pubescens TaxID=154538 RepID=A0A1M2V247_TRAPU|nr:hypothetical protein TRAPUB_7913 [Trametes pubescens]
MNLDLSMFASSPRAARGYTPPPTRRSTTPRNASAGPSTFSAELEACAELHAGLCFLPLEDAPSSSQNPDVTAALHHTQPSCEVPGYQTTTSVLPPATPYATPSAANVPELAEIVRPPSLPLEPVPFPPTLNWPPLGQRQLEAVHRRPLSQPPPPVSFMPRPPQSRASQPRPLQRARPPLTRKQAEQRADTLLRLQKQRADVGNAQGPAASSGRNDMAGFNATTSSMGVGSHAQNQNGPFPPWEAEQSAASDAHNPAAAPAAHTRPPENRNWPDVDAHPQSSEAVAATQWTAENAQYLEQKRQTLMRAYMCTYIAGGGPVSALEGLPSSMAAPFLESATPAVHVPVTGVPYPQPTAAGSSNAALPQNARTAPEPASPDSSSDTSSNEPGAKRILTPVEEAFQRRRAWNPDADRFVGHCWYGYVGEDGFIRSFDPPRPCDGLCESHRVLREGVRRR